MGTQQGIGIGSGGRCFCNADGFVSISAKRRLNAYDVLLTVIGVTTRLLETGSDEEEGMSPFQILFARMSITVICAMIYMWYTRVEHFPLGAPGIRLILVARGVGGFFGVFGMYWSLQYLPIADATVLSFLGPPLACYICSKLLKEPFTRTEQIAASVSLAGVILIARPTAFFSPTGEDKTTEGVVESASASTRNTSNIQIRTVDSSMQEASPHQRLAAVGMGMVGVLGAATAYTTIRWIGQRAHPLISVNYFASWTTLVSAIALAFVPSVPFVLPHTLRQWLLLLYIGVSGFVMQYLLTAGLAYEKSSRANNMVYSQMIFALAADALIWKHFPSALSVGGSSLILGSAVVVAIQKQKIEVVDAIDAGRAEEPREEEEEERQGLMQNATDMEEGRVSPTDAVEMQDQPRHQQSTRAEGPARNE